MQTKIEGHPGLVRDDNKVIRNTNTSDFRAYLNRRQVAIENKQRIEKLEQDNAEIKESLAMILFLLQNKESSNAS